MWLFSSRLPPGVEKLNTTFNQNYLGVKLPAVTDLMCIKIVVFL